LSEGLGGELGALIGDEMLGRLAGEKDGVLEKGRDVSGRWLRRGGDRGQPFIINKYLVFCGWGGLLCMAYG